MQIMLSIYLNSSTCKYLSLDNGVTMTSKRRENINLVSFICLSFLVISFSKQLLIIYTSELILCSTICVPSATRHNIHMYPYFLFAAIHHLKSSPTFSVRPCSSVGRVTEDLIRRSWVRFPPRSKDFFFASCGSLFPFTRANAQWVIHGFK